MKRIIFTICGLLFVGMVQAQTLANFRNPIIYADYSDPDICRVGEDYYMTASSFNCVPGLPILHSRDLINWELMGYALQAVPPVEEYFAPRHGDGVWAPSIRYHNGEFYIYWGDPDYGIFMVKSADARVWGEPVLIKAGRGIIDPCPLWDDDGRAYIVHGWARSRAGFNSILSVFEMSTDGTRAISEERIVYDGNFDGNHTIEGPKIYKRGGYYYIFAPAGGVATGWQLAMRAKSIYGVYDVRRVLEQGSTSVNAPHQGGWVETPSGENWFVHFQDVGVAGRIVHLQPMKWGADGFPVIGNNGFPSIAPSRGHLKLVNYTLPTSDEFTDGYGLQWQWEANVGDRIFGMATVQGTMRIFSWGGEQNLWNVPNLFLQKFPEREFTVKVKLNLASVEVGERGGLVIMGRDYCAFALERTEEGMRLIQIVRRDADKDKPEMVRIITSVPMTTAVYGAFSRSVSADIYLRIKVRGGSECSLSYSINDEHYVSVGDKFTAREGRWIGAKVGLFATTPHPTSRGWVECDWIKIE